MAKMNSKFKYMYDAAPASALVTKNGTPHTATFNGNDIALDTLDGYWNTTGELADMVFAVAVNVDALDHTTGDETYTLTLEFGDDASFTNNVTTHTLVVTKTGQYAFLVDIDTVKAVLSTTKHMRLVGTLAGTTPSITLYAWIAGAIVDGGV